MRYGSVCRGVEAATLAWKSLGWKYVFVRGRLKFGGGQIQHLSRLW